MFFNEINKYYFMQLFFLKLGGKILKMILMSNKNYRIFYYKFLIKI